MYVGIDYAPLDAGLDADVLSMDYAAVLQLGETITGVTVQLAVVEGNDSTPSARLSGSATFSGSVVSQLVDVRGLVGLIGGIFYMITFVVMTNQRPALSRWSHFWAQVPPVGP